MAERQRSAPSVEAGWAPGTPVVVRNRFIAGWATGFVVESVEPRGCDRYRLRRLSDNAVLPAAFSAEDLREA
jgi:hypothetical protein